MRGEGSREKGRTELDSDDLVETGNERRVENDERVEEVGVGGDGFEDEFGEGGGDV